MAKRGLFQSIFGGKSEKNKDFHAYKLLSSWESTFVPYSGNMWDINTVRSAVDAFARRASTAQPRHVRQSAETTVAVNDYIDRILQFRPNPYMTAADFYYKLAAQYKVYNNAIAYPVFDETGRLTAIYPINAQYFELLEYMGRGCGGMITVEKAKKLRAIIERAVAALELDNEAALECVELFPAWENGKAYTVETRVQYGGKLYRCVQAHTSQSDWTPPVAASLWSGVTVDPATGYDEWKQPTGAHDAYKKGDRVLFNGSVYESLIDGNAYSPTAYPAGWKLIE